jgi:nitrogen fixation NifU-like protein
MDIYREEFMEIYKNPMNQGKIPNPSLIEHGVNESCGDEMDLYLKFNGDILEDVSFEAKSCSVGLVSSALLTEEFKGKTKQEILNFSKEELLKLLGINLTTSRIKCALLPLETFHKAVQNK